MPSNLTSPDEVRWLDVVVISLLVALFAGAVGGTPVLMGVLLKQHRYSSAFVGLSAGMTPLGLIVGAFAVPLLTRRVSAFALATGCALGGALLLLLMAQWEDPRVWLLARLLWGMAIAGFYIVSKAWIACLTPAAQRGKVIGIFTTFLAAGFSCGPLLLSLVDFSSDAGLGLLSGLLVLSCIGLVMWRRRVPPFKKEESVSVLRFLPLAPILVASTALFGLFDHATLAFLPAYGVDQGVALREMGVAVAVLNIGNVVLQVPIGWLADRYPRKWVLAGCAALTAAGAACLGAVAPTPLFMPFLFVWGALAYGVSTVATALLGDHFRGGALLAGSAALTMGSGVGGVVGPPVIGLGMDVFGAAFFPAAISVGFAMLAVLAAVHGGVRPGSRPS
ncbi:MFS transporter [Ramlibacter tataouinensis]|uniref:Candidate transporter n=1 Tax=Ramlibacter tataouinensis (strain ATCC BAA-407 / DSM 14655 / LMG 21543 / TTB310) TaxID=365046 RepID=F5Y1I1_RAMTT|nr:MFS transporter [Ramlibacter tataouinensis]AEG94765.1 Candidate transporter [Ramlibacter tataouinensis TTB310]